MAEAVSRRAFAATWRDAQTDQVISTTWGGTMCWFPLRPWRLRIARDDWQHIIRCGECPGCLEFDRRRLADRLSVKYRGSGTSRPASCSGAAGADVDKHQTQQGPLYLVRIYAPLEKHSSLSHSLHRRKKLGLEPGFFRLGVNCFGVLVREFAPLSHALARATLRHRVEPIRFNRGRRAWRGITAGLLISREVYGEQTKRYYARGLPAAERQKWEVLKRGFGKGYSRNSSPRGWRGDAVVLVPPEVWRLRAADRNSLRRALHGANDPENVEALMGLVSDILTGTRRANSPQVPDRQRLTREQVIEHYAAMARRQQKSTARERAPKDQQTQPGGAGYVSSEHSAGSIQPKILSDEELLAIGETGKPRWMEREEARELPDRRPDDDRRVRARRQLDEQLERLREKIRRRENGGG